MAGCAVKHDNPYCSTGYRKIYVDVAYEISRIRDLEQLSRAISGNGPSAMRKREACRKGVQDSRDRIRAVQMRCARGAYGLAAQFTV